MAKGLCGLQRKRFQHSCGRPIHPKSGIPSQENELRNGISRPIEEAQCGIRSEICVRLGVAPTALPKFFFELTQPSRDWANFYRASSAPRKKRKVPYSPCHPVCPEPRRYRSEPRPILAPVIPILAAVTPSAVEACLLQAGISIRCEMPLPHPSPRKKSTARTHDSQIQRRRLTSTLLRLLYGTISSPRPAIRPRSKLR